MTLFFLFFFLTFRGFYHHHHKFCGGLLVQKWRLSIQGSHWNWDTEEGPRRWETRVFSLSFSLTVFSFTLYSLHLSLSCRSSSSLIGAVQSADSPFMADGGRGVGLLECWHVPIRATVLHYSISARESTAVKASFISGLELS